MEGTGSLYNQHILAGQLGLPWEEPYFTRARDLAGRLARFQAPRFPRPRVLKHSKPDSMIAILRMPEFRSATKIKKIRQTSRLCGAKRTYWGGIADFTHQQLFRASHTQQPHRGFPLAGIVTFGYLGEGQHDV